MTHLLASTFVRGQAFQVMRTPSIPSGSVVAISVDILAGKMEDFGGVVMEDLGIEKLGFERGEKLESKAEREERDFYVLCVCWI